jgi:hypothetical protein
MIGVDNADLMVTTLKHVYIASISIVRIGNFNGQNLEQQIQL